MEVTKDEELRQLLSLLNASEEENSIKGLEQLAACVDEPTDLLQRFITSSPEASEVFRIWDDLMREHETLSKSGVLPHLLDAFRALLGIDDSVRRSVILKKLSRHGVVRQLWLLLSAEKHKVLRACLKLLTSATGASTAVAREVFHLLNFQAKFFTNLSVRKGQRSNSKTEDVRDCFVRFLLSLLQSGDASVIESCLGAKGFVMMVVKGIHTDSPEVATVTIETFFSAVVANDNIAVKHKRALFSGPIVDNMLKVVAGEDEALSKLVRDLLIAACCTDKYHVWRREAPSRDPHKPTSSPAHLAKCFLSLQPNEVTEHQLLILEVLHAYPSLITSYIKSLPYSFEPRLSLKWVANVTFLTKLLRLPTPLWSVGKDASAAVELCLPQCFNRAVMTRALQHKSPLVRRLTLDFLCTAMWKVSQCKRLISGRANYDAGDKDNRFSQFESGIKKRLPDGNVLLSLRANAWSPVVDAKANQDESETLEVTYSVVLKTMLSIQTHVPEVLLETAFDFGKLVHPYLLTASPLVTYQSLSLLQLTSSNQFRSWTLPGAEKGNSSNVSRFHILLELMVSTTCEETHRLCRKLAVTILHSSSLFERCESEAEVWLSHLLAGGTTDLSFLCMALFECFNNPYPYISDTVDVGEDTDMGKSSNVLCSPLALCCVKKLSHGPSTAEDVTYVMSVVKDIYLKHHNPSVFGRRIAAAFGDTPSGVIKNVSLSRLSQMILSPCTVPTKVLVEKDGEKILRKHTVLEIVADQKLLFSVAGSFLKIVHDEKNWGRLRQVMWLSTSTPLAGVVGEEQNVSSLSKCFEFLSTVKAGSLMQHAMALLQGRTGVIASSVKHTLRHSMVTPAREEVSTMLKDVCRGVVHCLNVMDLGGDSGEAACTGDGEPRPDLQLLVDVVGDVLDMASASQQDDLMKWIEACLLSCKTLRHHWMLASGGTPHTASNKLSVVVAMVILKANDNANTSEVAKHFTIALTDSVANQIRQAGAVHSHVGHLFCGLLSHLEDEAVVSIGKALLTLPSVVIGDTVEGWMARNIFSQENSTLLLSTTTDAISVDVFQQLTAFSMKTSDTSVDAFLLHLCELPITSRTVEGTLQLSFPQDAFEYFLNNLTSVVRAKLLQNVMRRNFGLLVRNAENIVRIIVTSLGNGSECDVSTKSKRRKTDTHFSCSSAHALHLLAGLVQGGGLLVVEKSKGLGLRDAVLDFHLQSTTTRGGDGVDDDCVVYACLEELLSNFPLELSQRQKLVTQSVAGDPDTWTEGSISFCRYLLFGRDGDADDDHGDSDSTSDGDGTWGPKSWLGMEETVGNVANRMRMGLSNYLYREKTPSNRGVVEAAQDVLVGVVGSCMFASIPAANLEDGLLKFATSVLKYAHDEPAFVALKRMILSLMARQDISQKKSFVSDVGNIHSLIFGHSQFPKWISPSTDGSTHLGRELMHIVGSIVDQYPQFCSKEFVPILLTAYGATMSQFDRLILRILRVYEKQGMSLRKVVHCFGETVTQLLMGKTTSIDAVQNKFYDMFEVRNMTLSSQFFDVNVPMLGLEEEGEPEFDAVEKSMKDVVGLNVDGATVSRDDIYDPSFVLPAITQHFLSSVVDSRKVVEMRALSFAVTCMSSRALSVRRVAYAAVSAYYSLLESSDYRERNQVGNLLCGFKNSITSEFQRIPSIIATFVSESLSLMLHPESGLYPIVNRFLLQRPFLDLADVPLFYNLFNSGGETYKKDRSWMLKVLECGFRHSSDYALLKRRHCLEIMMVYYNAPMADFYTRRMILQLLVSITSHSYSCGAVIMDCSLLTWVAQMFGRKCPDSLAKPLIPLVLDVLDNVLKFAPLKKLPGVITSLAGVACQIMQSLDNFETQHLVRAVDVCRVITLRCSDLNKHSSGSAAVGPLFTYVDIHRLLNSTHATNGSFALRKHIVGLLCAALPHLHPLAAVDVVPLYLQLLDQYDAINNESAMLGASGVHEIATSLRELLRFSFAYIGVPFTSDQANRLRTLLFAVSTTLCLREGCRLCREVAKLGNAMLFRLKDPNCAVLENSLERVLLQQISEDENSFVVEKSNVLAGRVASYALACGVGDVVDDGTRQAVTECVTSTQ